jgi:hypothetical protein
VKESIKEQLPLHYNCYQYYYSTMVSTKDQQHPQLTPANLYGSIGTPAVETLESDVTEPAPMTMWQSALQEARSLLHIAVPTIIIQLGFTIPPFMTASYVGRTFGPAYLDGFQLASLTGNLFTLSLLQGLYSASDTLSPQAYTAGNYSELGLIAMRGFLASMAVVIPVCIPLAFCIQKLLLVFGEDPEASLHAGQWYSVYVFSLPVYVFFTYGSTPPPPSVSMFCSVFDYDPVSNTRLFIGWLIDCYFLVL